METLKTMGAVAGIGGLALGVFLILFRDFLRKLLLPQLGKDQAYRLLRLFLILVWSVAIVGIAAWVVLELRPKPTVAMQVPEGCLPKQIVQGNIVFLEVQATCAGAQQKQLAQANASALVKQIQMLTGGQAVVFLPAMRQYIGNPSPERWKGVQLEINLIKDLIDKTTRSIIELDPATQDKAKNEIKELVEVMQDRSAMLFQLPDTPMDPQAAKDWIIRYEQLLQRLRVIVTNIEGKLATGTS